MAVRTSAAGSPVCSVPGACSELAVMKLRLAAPELLVDLAKIAHTRMSV